MEVNLVLMPWYRRESPSPELAMSTAILRSNGLQVHVNDFNQAIFNDKFTPRKYWKYFLLDAPPDKEEDFLKLTKEVFYNYARSLLSKNPKFIVFKITGKTYANSMKMAKVIKTKAGGTHLS